jgi:hypothetical protein
MATSRGIDAPVLYGLDKIIKAFSQNVISTSTGSKCWPEVKRPEPDS